MIRLCFSAARDLAFLSATPEQGEKSTARRIVGLLGVGVFGNAILRPPFSQTNSIQIFIIINIQQFIGKRPQDFEEIPFGF
jgi:NADH/NAD ratio-sensing transcriptional regulator Rex